MLQSRLDRSPLAAANGESQHDQVEFRLQSFGDCRRVIGGTVVNDDNFGQRQSIARASQQFAEGRSFAVARDQNS